jgi:hypothetical protein
MRFGHAQARPNSLEQSHQGLTAYRGIPRGFLVVTWMRR